LLDYDSLPMLASHSMAIDYFNEQAFFQAHEAWEAAWRKSQRGTDEAFFNGLAKLGAGFTHIQRENAHGAFTLITKATERIEPYGPAHQGMDVAALCKDLRAVAATLAPAARKKAKPPATAFPVIARSP
jgi:predicted metal-dependent hydrolase